MATPALDDLLAASVDLRLGVWEDVLLGVECDALIADPPYSASRTHAGRGLERSDGGEVAGLTPTYSGWTPDDVARFVSWWAPRTRGWIVVLTDAELLPAWRDAYRAAGRYAFAPVPCVTRGMTVRLQGDGPSSWAVYAMGSRPKTRVFSKWGTLPGAYVDAYAREAGERVQRGGGGGRGKPQWLMRQLVRDYSRPGDLVCDPLAGWGSTLIAASALGRFSVGAEMDPVAHAEALTRLGAVDPR